MRVRVPKVPSVITLVVMCLVVMRVLFDRHRAPKMEEHVPMYAGMRVAVNPAAVTMGFGCD